MNDNLGFKCAESFKKDIEQAADQREMSTSEWLREAARQKLQREIQEAD